MTTPTATPASMSPAERRAARRHDATLNNGNPIGSCPCGECTKLDWQASVDGFDRPVSLAAFRRNFYPEAWD